jgi:predicted nucleotidyltransferase
MIYQLRNNNTTTQELVREALQITRELGDVVFVGAVAVYLYTKRTRTTRDLDFAVASKITNDKLTKKGYPIFQEKGKDVRRSPRGYKVDIYDRDVSKIPVETIFQTAKEIKVDKRGTTIKVASLEALIVAKHTASSPSRPQDDEDLYGIAQTNFNRINEESLKQLVDQHKFHVIMTTMKALHERR